MVAVGLLVVLGWLLVRRASSHDIAVIGARCGVIAYGGESTGTGVAVQEPDVAWVGYGPGAWGEDRRQTVVEGTLHVNANATAATFAALDGTSAELAPAAPGNRGPACAI